MKEGGGGGRHPCEGKGGKGILVKERGGGAKASL